MFDVYITLKNEAALLPYFLRYYGDRPTCRRIVALDNSSDDGSLAILAAHPKVDIRTFVPSTDSYVCDVQVWVNEVWRESVGLVQYAILSTVDEWVGPDLETRLNSYSAAGVTVLRPQAYDMVSEDFRSPFDVTRGVPSSFYNKPFVIDPNAIRSSNFTLGTHDAAFEGDVKLVSPKDLSIYHYRYLGREETWARYQALQLMRQAGDIVKGCGSQYEMTRSDFDAKFDSLLQQAIELEPLRPPE
ncbi:MAG: glycosyltransferase family 2 protein [Planctomycetota bacterium]